MKRTVAIALTSLALIAQAAEDKKSEPADQDNFFKRAAKVLGHDATVFGHDAKAAAQQAGDAYSKTAKEIGQGASKAVEDIAHGMKESAKKTSKAVTDTFK